MNDKKISPVLLKKILEKMPLEFRKKILLAAKNGKKIRLKITKHKNGLKSPYQNK